MFSCAAKHVASELLIVPAEQPKMSREYIRGKSWVELMEEEEETSDDSPGTEEKAVFEEERLLVENENSDAKEERLETKEPKEERLETKESKGENLNAVEKTEENEEKKVYNENFLASQDNSTTHLKVKLKASDIKIKTEIVHSSSEDVTCTHPMSDGNSSGVNNMPTKIIPLKDEIKTEPESQVRCNGDSSVVDIKQEIIVNDIKVKNEIDEIDDDERISKELDLMENELFNIRNETLDSLKDSVSDSVKDSISDSVKDSVSDSVEDSVVLEGNASGVTKRTDTDTFVHPEPIVNCDNKSSVKVGDRGQVSACTQTSPRKNRNARKRKSSSNIGNNKRKQSCRDPSASSSSSGRSSEATTPRKPKKPVEYETDPEILSRRQKQIDYGKNTIGYDRYKQLVPKEKRTNRDPRTPPKHIKYSRRAWDGMVKVWKKQLHVWDPTPEKESTTLPSFTVSVDVSATPYKRRIHTATESSASGSTEDVGTDDFISLDYEDIDVE